MAPLMSDHSRLDRLILAAASIFLGAKLRNTPFSIRRTVTAFFQVALSIDKGLSDIGLTDARSDLYS